MEDVDVDVTGLVCFVTNKKLQSKTNVNALHVNLAESGRRLATETAAATSNREQMCNLESYASGTNLNAIIGLAKPGTQSQWQQRLLSLIVALL